MTRPALRTLAVLLLPALLAGAPALAQQGPDADATRGISVRPAGPAAASQQPVAPQAPSADPQPAARPPSAAALDDPVRVIALGVDAAELAGLSQQTPWKSVAAGADTDIVWDAVRNQVLARGQIVAENIGRDDLPGVIERTASIRWIKTRATKAPQVIRLFPDDDLHRQGERVEIRVDNLQGRSLVLFNIAGNGTVQLLYPQASDARQWPAPQYRMPFKVTPPYGTDQVVAVTSGEMMPDLERAIRQLDKRRTPFKAVDVIRQFAPPDALVGSVSLATAP